MKRIITTIFLVGLLILSIPSYHQSYQSKPPVKSSVVVKKAPIKRVIHRKVKYTAPQGRVAEIALYVNRETGIELDTISRIMFYESQGYKVDALNHNTNKTTDHGYFQINSIHFTEAKKLGLDVINNPTDNAKMAIVLMKRNGLRDWKASQYMWQ